MNHLLSVIIPVYNVELYIERCIKSIINQSYKNLEIILINDGSKDSSGEICDSYAKKDLRIKVFHQKNQGQSVARNLGLENCSGDFISFVDSDDWIELEMYETLMDFVSKNNLEIIECNHQSTADKVIHRDSYLKIESKEDAALRIIKNHNFSVCRRIYSKKIIKNMRFKENYIYEDMIFVSELLCKIDRIGYFNKAYYNYFVQNTSSTMHGGYNMNNLNSINAILNFQENIKKCFGNNDQIIKVSKNYILFFAFHHYQKLFQYKKFDKKFLYRKQLKSIIDENYISDKKNSNYFKIARYSPIWLFNIISRIINK